MQIRKIYIKNFKGIEEKTVFFGDGEITALLGPNGLGKSSFIEALRFALTGVVPQNPVRDGAESAMVGIEMVDGTTFSRTVFVGDRPSKVTVNKRITPAKNLNSWLIENYNYGTDILKVATSTEVLSSMTSAELGDFLLKYIPEKLNVDKILGFISDPTEDIQEAILVSFPDEEFEIDAVSEVHESFMNIRKAAKKDLEFYNSKLTKLPATKPARKYETIQKDYEELCKKEGTSKLAADAIKVYDNVVAKRKVALDNLANMQAKFDAIEAVRPNPLLRENLEKKMSAERQQMSEAKSMIGIMQNSVKAFQSTLDRLSTNHCPLSDAIICTTDKTKVKAEIVENIENNKKGIALQEEKIKKCEEEIASLNLSVKKYDEETLKYKEKIMLGEQIEKLKKSIPELPPKKPDVIPSSFDFGKEKENLKKDMEYAKKWEERAPLEKKIAEETKKVATYDYLCKAFAPKGEVMTKILSSYLSIFEEAINQRAKEMRKGMEVKFRPENGIKYLVKVKEEKDFHLYDELSKGEKTLAAFLLLDLVSALCGTNMMILDDLNNLDNKALNEIFEIITSPDFKKGYDHIVVASVDSSEILDIAEKYKTIIHRA